MFSPIEHFDIAIIYSKFSIIFLYTYFTWYLFCCFIFLLILTIFLKYNLRIIPKKNQSLIELFYIFIWFNLVFTYLGKKGYVYFSNFFILFFFLLFINLMGLMPYGFTPTGYMIFNFFFSWSIWWGFFITSFIQNKFKYFTIFVPQVSIYIYMFLILIEILSYIIRAFSLAIRLGANITAGHTLLIVLIGFFINLFKYSLLILPILWIVLCLIFSLEIFVAFMQAYVCVVLICLYINESVFLDH